MTFFLGGGGVRGDVCLCVFAFCSAIPLNATPMQYQQVRQTAFGWICKVAMKKAKKDHQLQESKTLL